MILHGRSLPILTELGVLEYPTTKALGAQPSISSEALHAPDNATGKVSSFAGKTGCAHWYWRTVLEPGPKWVTWLPTFNVLPSHPTSLINLNEVCQYARPHYWQSTGPSQGQQHGNSACSAHSPGKYWLLLMVNWWGWSTIIVSARKRFLMMGDDGLTSQQRVVEKGLGWLLHFMISLVITL